MKKERKGYTDILRKKYTMEFFTHIFIDSTISTYDSFGKSDCISIRLEIGKFSPWRVSLSYRM